MKKITILLAGLFLSLASFAQNFHFVYLRIDNSMEIDRVKEQIRSLNDKFQNEDFVLYYSNFQTAMDATHYDEKELFGLINEQMSSSEITIPAEINRIAELLEKYLQAEFDENRQLVSLKYSQITFDFITGNNFVENKYQDEILARSIVINSLKNLDMQINFYPCGADYSSVKLNSLYNINKEINVKSI